MRRATRPDHWAREPEGPFVDKRRELCAVMLAANEPRTAIVERTGVARQTIAMWEAQDEMQARAAELRVVLKQDLPVSRAYIASRLKWILDRNTNPPDDDDEDGWRPDYNAAINASKELLKMLDRAEKEEASPTNPAPVVPRQLTDGQRKKSFVALLGTVPEKSEA